MRGDKELEELVVAIAEGEGGSRSNQELAADLRVPVTEVVNRRKRARRSCEKPWPRQANRKGAQSPMTPKRNGFRARSSP